MAEQLYSVTNPNAESVGRGLNMMEQYQAQADTFWILIRRLETRNYSVQESCASTAPATAWLLFKMLQLKLKSFPLIGAYQDFKTGE